MPAAGPPRFITIGFSHFCEKARWALDRAGVAYREESHVPILSWRATLRSGGRRTVPCLVTGQGVKADSTDILRWVDGQGGAPPLFPEGGSAELRAEVAAWEDELDRRLGPATRRMAYFHLLDQPETLRRLLVSAGGGWEARLGRMAFPLLRAVIVRGLRVTREGVERSEKTLAELFARVEARLADGRPYLCGDRFTAADLTFAALASPVVLPPAFAARMPIDPPPGVRALVDRLRARPAGAFALRLYERERDARPGARAA